jgi:hypothetical protein
VSGVIDFLVDFPFFVLVFYGESISLIKLDQLIFEGVIFRGQYALTGYCFVIWDKNRSTAFRCRVRSLKIIPATAFLTMQRNIVTTIRYIFA